MPGAARMRINVNQRPPPRGRLGWASAHRTRFPAQQLRVGLWLLVSGVLLFCFLTSPSTAAELDRELGVWGEVEQAVGAKDWERASDYQEDGFFGPAIRPVAYLQVDYTGGSSSPCTAFLVSEDLVVTAAHCLWPKEGAWCAPTVESIKAYFEYFQPHGHGNAYFVDKNPVLLDCRRDIVVLRASGQPGKIFGYLGVAESQVAERSAAFIVHHPQGFPKSLSRKHCRADSPISLEHEQLPGVTLDMVRHICDTQPGSSGAPVLVMEHRQVAAIHLRADKGPGANWGVAANELRTCLEGLLPEAGFESGLVLSADGSSSAEVPEASNSSPARLVEACFEKKSAGLQTAKGRSAQLLECIRTYGGARSKARD